MPNIVIVEKSGNLKTVQLKDFSPETICKKAGIKSIEGFKLQHTWGADDELDQTISLYAKTTGRAGQENKYDFPPPVDERLFFGSCALVGRNAETGEPVDLDEEMWEDIYEFLFGGFEDIGSEDSDDDEDDVDTEDEVDKLKQSGVVVERTKQGYAKDGFIVEDDEEDEFEPESEESESEEERPKKRAPRKSAAPKESKKKLIAQVVPIDTYQLEDCSDELSEESYE